MANQAQKITVEITDIKVQWSAGIAIVALKLADGERTWKRALQINYDRPVSLEEFQHDLAKMDLWPEDNYFYLREAVGKSFDLEVPPERER